MATAQYTPNTNDLAFADVPVANVRTNGAVFDDAQFVTIPNVPVFAEHETKCTAGKYEGRTLSFDYDALLSVCQRCNRRITETGDYPTIVLGHTPPRELVFQGKAKMPPVVGFVGPFRMGHIVMPNGMRRWAILGDFHVFRDKEKKLREYPRRSAELWLEERYEDMFLDPIALLSAEAPRLDMGLLYAFREQDQGGRLVEIYSAAAAPSAASVFVPELTGKQHYSGQGDSDMDGQLTPETIAQVVQAFMETAQMKWVASQMAQTGDPNGAPQPGGAPGADPMGGMPPPGAQDPMPNAGADPAAAAMPPGAAPVVPGAPGAGPMAGPAAANPGEPPKPYAGEDDDEGPGDDDSELEDGDEELELVGEPERMMHLSPKGRKGRRRRYSGEDEEVPPAKMPAKPDPEAYSMPALARKVQLLESQVQVERYSRINAQRRGFFETMAAKGYPIDVQTEMQICNASEMSKESFERYAKNLETTRVALPLERSLPEGESPIRPGKNVRVEADGRVSVAQYSNETSDKAMAICMAITAEGGEPDYETVLNEVAAGKR